MNYDDADNDHMEFDYLQQELFRSSWAIIRTCALTCTSYIHFFNLSPAQSHNVTIVAMDCHVLEYHCNEQTNKQYMQQMQQKEDKQLCVQHV